NKRGPCLSGRRLLGFRVPATERAPLSGEPGAERIEMRAAGRKRHTPVPVLRVLPRAPDQPVRAPRRPPLTAVAQPFRSLTGAQDLRMLYLRSSTELLPYPPYGYGSGIR